MTDNTKRADGIKCVVIKDKVYFTFPASGVSPSFTVSYPKRSGQLSGLPTKASE